MVAGGVIVFNEVSNDLTFMYAIINSNRFNLIILHKLYCYTVICIQFDNPRVWKCSGANCKVLVVIHNFVRNNKWYKRLVNTTADNTDSTSRHHGVYQEYGKTNLKKKISTQI